MSIVVPCFNEELVLSYLSNTLRSVETHLSERYSVHFVFVDDGSLDGTFDGLRRLFGHKDNCAFIRHSRNKGVAAAILTGVKSAETEIVCSIDCDCTYDPHELINMIPLLKDEVDLVTASPYHPRGKVRNVPGWRLALSRIASYLYRRVLRQKLYTYTSCFRVYRKSMTRELSLSESGFLGIAEMLGRLDLRGAKVVEYPTILEVRLFGRSKMKTLRTIGGHLRLLVRLLAMRVRGGADISSSLKDARIAKQKNSDSLLKFTRHRS
jgi:glycosyltransferase involved in cell wall biosynthesis